MGKVENEPNSLKIPGECAGKEAQIAIDDGAVTERINIFRVQVAG